MYPNGANACTRKPNDKARSRIACIRALYRILLATSLTVLTVSLIPPVRAELSEEQKARVRALLPTPQLLFGFSFHFSRTRDFGIKINDRENRDCDRARLASLLKQPPPDDAVARLHYLRTVGDRQSVLEDVAAKGTYDKGEKLALSLAREGTPRVRARFLALAGGFHADQEEYKEANVLLKEAWQLAPDTWEVRYLESLLLWEQVSLEMPDPYAAQLLRDSKASSEAGKTALRLADDSFSAINKAVALQEMTTPDPKDRNPKLYITRMFFRFQVEAVRKIIAAQKNGQPPPFPKKFECDFSLDKAALRDIEYAASCEPDNPYAILTRHLARASKSQTDEATAKESERALVRLAAIEKQPSIDSENRLRLLEVQIIILSMQENWDAVAEKTLQGLALSPSRELFRVVHPMNLIRQKKFAEAEQSARELLEKYDTPFNRMILARAQLAQGDFIGAERTLIPLVETDKSNATPALYLATVRLKATSSNSSRTKLREIKDFVEGLGDTYPGRFSAEEKLSSNLLIATYYALDGAEDIAKTMIQRILDDDANNASVKSLLAVLP